MFTDKDFEKLNTLIDSKLDHVVQVLTTHIDNRIDAVNEKIDTIQETVQATAVAIDKQAGVNEELRQEFAMMNGQITRHEGWIQKIADKTEVKLEY